MGRTLAEGDAGINGDRPGEPLRALSLVNALGEEERAHGEVFVERRPVDTDAPPNETPLCEVVGRSVTQLRKPLEGHVDRSPILELDDELACRELDLCGPGLVRC
jgi:hypothetical protein